MPTEILGQEAHELRELGQEYGATTGRPRRLYYPDLTNLRYTLDMTPKPRGLVITKLDTLKGRIIKVYDGHLDKENKEFKVLKRSPKILAQFSGLNEISFGPLEDVSNFKTAKELEGTEAGKYLNYLSKKLDAEILMVGNGPGFDDFIEF